MKKYGIYLAYPPTVNLQNEGLGRHLIEFLKGAEARGGVYFVIACPSWMRINLVKLFSDSGISSSVYELMSPKSQPVILSLYERYRTFKARTPRGRKKAYRSYMQYKLSRCNLYVKKQLLTTRMLVVFAPLGMSALILAFFIKLALLPVLAFKQFWLKLKALKNSKLDRYLQYWTHLLAYPKLNYNVFALYQVMHSAEIKLMLAMINKRRDIAAWYSPTSFWPSFNDIKAPKLLCLPDVVLTELPVAYSAVGDERFLSTFNQVEATIRGGTNFVSYSSEVKYNILVKRYGQNPANIDVVAHGVNRLDEHIMLAGFKDNHAATTILCNKLLQVALSRCDIAHIDPQALKDPSYIHKLDFIFYASQFRPNKNIISLLRAYNYLLKKRFIGFKLVLTGSLAYAPEAKEFIESNQLERDVLCLHGLSIQELAACYHLAALAVNPSFSEGGCPFTFSEALSVGTPVVMAKIPVTQELIDCPELNELMFFDPYDWSSMAGRIEWALNNLALLLEKQSTLYKRIAQRTWAEVVGDYIKILERIAAADSLMVKSD